MMTSDPVSLLEYLRRMPDDDEWAQDVADRYRGMTAAERLRELSLLGAWMDAILAGRSPTSLDGELPFWQIWKDPLHGRAG